MCIFVIILTVVFINYPFLCLSPIYITRWFSLSEPSAILRSISLVSVCSGKSSELLNAYKKLTNYYVNESMMDKHINNCIYKGRQFLGSSPNDLFSVYCRRYLNGSNDQSPLFY